MSPGRRACAGFALLPVVLALALLAATAYLMTREAATGIALVSSAQQSDRARYVAEAALQHATWQVQTSNCSGFSDVSSTPFGDGSYAATVTPTSGSPVTLTATGTLADGTSHAIDRSGVAAYETPSTLVLQLGTDPGRDTIIEDFYQRNYGGANYLKLSADPNWLQHLLLDFDVSSIPTQATILSAQLQLRMWSLGAAGSATAHRVTRDWLEGTRNGGGTADGATWQTHDGTNAWSDPGGDFAAAPLAEASIQPGDTWVTWEIAPLVQQWVDGVPNQGVLLAGAAGLDVAEFASRETNSPADRPKLTIAYTCECGKICGAPGGGGKLLVVVGNAAAPSGKDSDRQALMQSWGYAVTLIDDGDSQADFDAATAASDVVYVTASVVGGTLLDKLTGSTTGIVNEFPGKLDNFGFSSSTTYTFSADTFTSTDAVHFISSPFGGGAINALTTVLSMPIPGGTLAPGLEVPASFTGFERAVVTLDVGATRWDGGSAPARRVQLPFGPAETTQLTTDGLTIMRRSIEWAGGAGCVSLTPLLLVVSDASNPSSQEAARQTLIESWCYAVTLISDDATTAEYAAAMALNDVIYISQEITSLTSVTKLRNAAIGVVNEEYLISSDLGLGSGTGTGFFNDIDLVDDSHYITSEFGLGALALFTPSYDLYTGTGFTLAPDLQVLGETGSITGLMALETGGALWDSGIAAGRRVQVPWGDDFSALNTDGQAIMQRAIEWAAEAGGGGPAETVLLVSGDAGAPSAKDLGIEALVVGWGFTVDWIDDGDTQQNFTTKMDAADVVYVSGTVSGPTLLDKVTGTTTAVVNEINGKLDNFGFSSSTSSTAASDRFTSTDPLHYIAEPFAGGFATIFTTSATMPVPGGTLALDLQNVGEVSGAPALVTLDAGATRWDGNPAPARRAHLPFTNVDPSQLTLDGETIMQRTIRWATGEGGSGGGEPPTGAVVFEGFAEVNPSTTYNVDVPTPAGTLEGDLLIAAIASDEGPPDLAAPGGWSLIALQAYTTRVTLGVWWKIAAASEPATHLFTSSQFEMKYGWMMRFSGHDPANPIHASSFDIGSSRDPTVPSTTTTVANSLILRIGGFDHDDITPGDPGLVGHAPITMALGGSGLGACAGGAGYQLQPAAGSTGTVQFTLTAKEEYVAGTIAIAPPQN